MSNVDANPGLDKVLARTASAGLSTRWTKSCPTPEDALWFFVDCVQTTILPRRLKVFVDDRVCLTVVANGGRLIEILDGQEACGLGLSTRMLQTSDLPEICDALRNLFVDHGRVAVVPLPAEADPNAALHGIRGQDLMRALVGIPPARDGGDRLSDLIAAAQDVVLGIWQSTGSPSVLADGFEFTEPLLDWMTQVFFALSARGADAIEEQLCVLHAPESPSITGCFHIADGKQTAIVIHRDAATDVAEYWATAGQ